MNYQGYLSKWIQFSVERFSLAAYSLMIFVFLAAHYRIAAEHGDVFAGFSEPRRILYWLPLWLAVFLFFFKLRLFDEVKDLEYDRANNPNRPLPRGLLEKKDVLRAAFFCTGMEMALFGAYGIRPFVAVLPAVGYSFLMYREFFASKLLRPHLTTYAVAHTFVVVLLSAAVFCAILNLSIARIPGGLIYFSFAGWFVFNIFEFARKSFSVTEEKPGIESYSKIFGKLGAVGLTLVMAVLAILFMNKGGASYANGFLLLWAAVLFFAGLAYSLSDRAGWAKFYRAAASLFIILSYAAAAFLF